MKITTLFFLFKMFGNEISLADGIVIALTVILVLMGIIFGIPVIKTWKSEKKKEKLKKLSLFKDSNWINASQLTYSSLDFIREMQKEQNPSSQEGIREAILEILNKRRLTENQNHILLIGPSLSGKSHITVSVLKNLPDAYVLRPNEITFNNAAKEGFEFPDLPQDAQYAIVLFDNFHEFFKGSESSPIELIHKTIENGFTIWANCISLEEYERVNNFLDFKTIESFKEIKLDKRLNKDEENKIAINLGKEKPLSTSNGLIGEIIYPPKDIIQHYYDLKNDADSTPYDVLILIKQAYLLGSFTLPYSMKIELLQMAYLKEYPENNTNLRNALKKIEIKGFIKLLNDNLSFSFDSVWLNEIVAPELKPKEFYLFWEDIIPINVIQYNNLILASKNYFEAESYYFKMKNARIVPNLYTLNILISLSPNYETVLEWFKKIENGEANIITYNSLINKSPNYETALEWFKKIENGEANIITYNSLINKSPNYETALEWFKKIENGKADIITYNSLIHKSPNYEIALEWFNKIEVGKTNVVTYNSLIHKSPNYKTAIEWFSKIEYGNENVITYNSIINKSRNYYTALDWFYEIENGKADVITYNSLIRISPNYKTALEWFNKIKNGEANVTTYNFLINKSPNYEIALEWFDKIENGKANVTTYNFLINKSPNYEIALEWFNKIENGKANASTYNSLVRKSPDYQQDLKLIKLKKTKKDKKGEIDNVQ